MYCKKTQKSPGVTCTKDQVGETTASKKKRDAHKDGKANAGDNLILKDGTSIKILSPNEHVKYLGKQFNLINHTNKDIDERTRKGLIKFNEFKPALCQRSIQKQKMVFIRISHNQHSAIWIMLVDYE